MMTSERPSASPDPEAGAGGATPAAADLLEIAIALRRVADETDNASAAAELRRLAFAYLDKAEIAQMQENLGKPILGR